MLEVFTVDTKPLKRPCSPSVMQQPRNMPLRFPGEKTKLLVFPALLNVNVGPKNAGFLAVSSLTNNKVCLFLFLCFLVVNKITTV